MEKIVIFGCTDFSELVGYYLERDSRYSLLGYTVDRKYVSTVQKSIRVVIPFEDLSQKLPDRDYRILLTVGYNSMNENRRQTAARIRAAGYNLASYISKEADVEAECMGEGTIILPGCVVQPFCRLGEGNLFESGCTISHHAVIGDYNFFAPAVALAGQVHIGSNCFLGNNCTVKNGVSISDRALIGAGAYVAHDVLADTVLVPERSVELPRKSSDMKI